MVSVKPHANKWVALVFIGLLTLATIPLPNVQAATTTVMASTLPTARDGTSAVAAPDGIYIFGGNVPVTGGSSRTDQILLFDPRTDTLTNTGATLPTARSDTSAVWTGSVAYIFGGWGSPYNDDIVRYDPATNDVTLLSTTLPTARGYTSAVWTGTYAYIFGGGTDGGVTTSQILRFDPATGTISTMGATLPGGHYGTSAVWDGQYAYIFGGLTQSSSSDPAIKHDSIVRYDPATDTTTLLAAKLPTARYHTSAVLVGSTAYIFGGYSCASGTPCATILQFDTTAGSITTSTTTLSSARFATSAAYMARHAFIIGGDTGGAKTNQILRHGALAANTAPVIADVPDTAAQATYDLNITTTASDADHDLLTFTASGVPAGATFTDNGDGTARLDWNPTRNQIGLHTVTITVSDGTDTDSDSFTIDVTQGPDRAPVLDPIADQNAIAATLLTVNVSASDADGDPIVLSAPVLPSGATFTDNGDGTGAFGWTPTRSQGGDHGVQIQAVANGVTVTENFTVNVTVPPNTAPVIDQVASSTAFVGNWVNITFAVSDAEGDVVTTTLTGLPSGATYDGVAHKLVWQVTSAHLGVHAMEVNATDGDLSSLMAFDVTVYSGPEPIVESPQGTVREGESITFDINATDPSGGNLTLFIDPMPLPAGAVFVDNGDGTAHFSWQVAYDAAGVYSFTITADNGERTGTGILKITVQNVDRAPTFDPITNERIAVTSDLTKTVTASDPDGTAVAITALSLPAGASITTSPNSATITWNDAGPIGKYTVELAGTADGKIVKVKFTIDVVAQYAFAISAVTPSPILMSPNETVGITIRIVNTGFNTDTYEITAFDASSRPEGFTFVPSTLDPGTVTVAGGQSAEFTVTMKSPLDATSARPRVIVSSESVTLVRQLNWLAHIPVVVTVVTVADPATIADGNALVLFSGHVNLTFRNGEPVVNQPFTLRHNLQNVPLETLTPGTDENGTWAFDGLTQPTFGLPGDHTVTVSVTRKARTDTATDGWTIGVA